MDNAKLQQKPGLYHFGAFSLDAAERRLWCENAPVSLTPKQFDLLFYFVENAGRTIKKGELLDAVWADAYVEETTLARNVSWLRTKLSECGETESLIETVPKLGYRFTADVTRPNENALIIEEQTVQHFRGEETITFNDAELAVTTKTKLAKSRAVFYLPLLLVFLALIAGGGYALYRNQKTDDKAANTLEQATQVNIKATITIKNITVDATREAVEVGVKIQPGDVIKVSAMGIHQPEGLQTWTFEGEAKGEIFTSHTFQKAAPWSLVAWVGTETDKTDHFQASTNTAFQAQKSGSLYLAVNDLIGSYSDNRGGLNVAVVLYRQYRIDAEGDNPESAWGNGLVNIHENDTLAIHSRGNVSYWKNGELYDLNGSNHSNLDHLAPEINARSFIAKIGNYPAFKAGTDFPPQKMNISGWLFLSVNDRIFNKGPDSYRNNSGEITTDVEVVRQPENFKNPIQTK